MTSIQTTVGGIIAIIATVALLVSKLMNDEPITPTVLLELFALLGIGGAAGWTGLHARDDRVSSEGTKAPKDMDLE